MEKQYTKEELLQLIAKYGESYRNGTIEQMEQLAAWEQQLAWNYMRSRESDEGVQHIKNAIALRESVLSALPSDSPEDVTIDKVGKLANTYSYAGFLFRNFTGDWDTAEEYYIKAVRLAEFAADLNRIKSAELLANCCNSAGGILSLNEKYEQAEEYLKEGLRIRENVLVADRYTRAKALYSSYYNLAAHYTHKEDYVSACEYYKKAIEASEVCCSADPQKHFTDLAFVSQCYGELLIKLGNTKEAERVLLHGEEIVDRYNNYTVPYGPHLSILRMLAELYESTGRNDRAEYYRAKWNKARNR